MRPFLIFAGFFTAAVCASSASAESAAVFIPYTEQRADLRLANQTLDLVAKWLRERDIDVVLPEQAAEQLPVDLRYCRQEECAPGYLQYLKVDYAVLSTVVGHPKGKGARDISVCLMTPAGEKYEQRWAVTDSIWLAVDAALVRVYTAFLRGLGPWISVQGTPLGAEVAIDGQRVGMLPYRGKIKSGRHQIAVRQPGFKPYNTSVEIDKGVNLLKELEVALHQKAFSPRAISPQAAAASSDTAKGDRAASQGLGDSEPDRGSRRPSVWNYLVGGALLAGAVPLIAIPAISIGEDPKELENAKGNNPRNLALLIGGVAAVAAGTVFLLAQPINE